MNGDAFAARRIRRGTAPLEALSTQDETSHDDYVPVPLPTEVPSAPNLSRLPNEVLHSGTVETLIAHNEDLIARLKVNLRRNALLEQQIIGLEKQIGELRQLNETLEDQVHIVRERDRLFNEKNARSENRANDLKNELEMLRIQLRESEATYSEQKQRLEAYVRRVRRWVRPGFKRALNKLQKENLQNREFIHHTELLRRDLAQKDIEVGDLARQVAELRGFQRERERSFQKDQATLVEKYESQLTTIRKENEELSLHLSFYRDRATLLDEMTRRQIEAENRAVAAERLAQDLDNRINTEIRDLSATRDEAKRESATLRQQVEILRSEMRKTREEAERIEAENDRMQDQLASLQVLWNEGRKSTEELELRLQGLTQINQELSRKLKEQRTQNEIETLNLKSAVSTEETETSGSRTFRKIDSLLATIESGFPGSSSAESMKVRDLQFVESEKQASEPEASV